jgi:DNA repair photolyase
MLNKQKGNMYPWVTHTWNAIKGKCPHGCSYCYMKRFPQKEIRFDKKELETNLGTGNTIFVGSSNDMFAESIPVDWIWKILEHCSKYENNTYVFQSKNPLRFTEFSYTFPETEILLGTTIESNRPYLSTAPTMLERKRAIQLLGKNHNVFVSIEPIMDFDVSVLSEWIKDIYPKFISVGADSQGYNLPEPTKEKIESFLDSIKGYSSIEVKLKDNLKRILR